MLIGQITFSQKKGCDICEEHYGRLLGAHWKGQIIVII